MTGVRILIIGGASLDTLDGADELVAGGAGMYTAMASRHSGAAITLFAPRPDPMPPALLEVASSLEWLGPIVAESDLPHFEITYKDGHAEYVHSYFGAEDTLSPEELPSDLSGYDCVHLVPLGNLRQQLDFLRACRQRGARYISAGTALHLINKQPEIASSVLEASDLFFMNEKEAVRLFGSMTAVTSRPDQTIFVTKGSGGATVIQGEVSTHLPGSAANVIDPTGAGDTFCGATLVSLVLGEHPVMAARQAIPLATRTIEAIGPGALLSPTQSRPHEDKRVIVNAANISKIAQLITGISDIAPFAFTGPDLPATGHPATLDYFFATALQQFGFWSEADGHYNQPLIAMVDGEERKGAFYLFRAWLRWLESDAYKLTADGQAELTEDDILTVLRADDGTDPMPALDMHLTMAQQYGRDMLELGLTPQTIMEQVKASAAPLRTLFQFLDHISGYKEDPLRKKAGLLAIILQQRPEAFLASSEEEMPPVVDYHVMRSCLRMGLIDVVDDSLVEKLAGRQLLSASEEWAVRMSAHAAVEQVVARSGKSMGAVDWFFFQARKRCPEMSEPLCKECSVDPACSHRKELFQPVRRTSFY